jgi:hypothetical protein
MADLISDVSHYPGGPSSGPANAANPNGDVSQVGGQDPASFLGIPFPYSTGAGVGSVPPGGESAAGADPSNEPNQYPATDAITGVSYGDGTGMPGTPGVSTGDPEPGGEPVSVTRPGLFIAGPVGGGPGTQMVTVTTTLSGINGTGQPGSMVIGGGSLPVRPQPTDAAGDMAAQWIKLGDQGVGGEGMFDYENGYFGGDGGVWRQT